jgi:hypothetical protein
MTRCFEIFAGILAICPILHHYDAMWIDDAPK